MDNDAKSYIMFSGQSFSIQDFKLKMNVVFYNVCVWQLQHNTNNAMQLACTGTVENKKKKLGWTSQKLLTTDLEKKSSLLPPLQLQLQFLHI